MAGDAARQLFSPSRTTDTFASQRTDQAKSEKQAQGSVAVLRDWTDAIAIAFLVAMFIRVFVAELFVIPSPSMTPTLLGIEPGRQAVSFYDQNGDGQEDMILRSDSSRFLHVYLKQGKTYHYAGEFNPGYDYDLWMRKAQRRQDRIVVAKFFYWFSPSKRGDIVVFKVPEQIFTSTKPIYIKRTVGLPGETLTFAPAPGVPGHEDSMGWLVVDGKRVTEPEFFQMQRYEWKNIPHVDPYGVPSFAKYRFHYDAADLLEVKVPRDGVYMLGDNTVSSQDSRYWGAVPLDRLRGRAVFRYWLRPGFLH